MKILLAVIGILVCQSSGGFAALAQTADAAKRSQTLRDVMSYSCLCCGKPLTQWTKHQSHVNKKGFMYIVVIIPCILTIQKTKKKRKMKFREKTTKLYIIVKKKS